MRRKRTRPSDYYNSIYSGKIQDVTRFRLRSPVRQRKNENAPSRQSQRGADKRAVSAVNIASSGKTKIIIAAGGKTIQLIATESEELRPTPGVNAQFMYSFCTKKQCIFTSINVKNRIKTAVNFQK